MRSKEEKGTIIIAILYILLTWGESFKSVKKMRDCIQSFWKIEITSEELQEMLNTLVESGDIEIDGCSRYVLTVQGERFVKEFYSSACNSREADNV